MPPGTSVTRGTCEETDASTARHKYSIHTDTPAQFRTMEVACVTCIAPPSIDRQHSSIIDACPVTPSARSSGVVGGTFTPTHTVSWPTSPAGRHLSLQENPVPLYRPTVCRRTLIRLFRCVACCNRLQACAQQKPLPDTATVQSCHCMPSSQGQRLCGICSKSPASAAVLIS